MLLSLFTFFAFQAATTTIGFDLPLVATLAAFVALPTKLVVDLIRGAWVSLPGNLVPIFGVVIAYGMCLLLLVANQNAFSASVFAQCVFAAITAQGGAMAVTGMQNKANEARKD